MMDNKTTMKLLSLKNEYKAEGVELRIENEKLKAENGRLQNIVDKNISYIEKLKSLLKVSERWGER